MTNGEASQWFRNTYPDFICNSDTSPIGKAISALKFKENYDRFWEEVKSAGMRGEEVEIHHSGRVFRIREVP